MNIKISAFGDIEVDNVEAEDLPRIEAFFAHIHELQMQELIAYEASRLAEDFPTTEEEEDETNED